MLKGENNWNTAFLSSKLSLKIAFPHDWLPAILGKEFLGKSGHRSPHGLCRSAAPYSPYSFIWKHFFPEWPFLVLPLTHFYYLSRQES